MTPSDLAAAYLALTPSEKAEFAKVAGLLSRAHGGSKRCKNPIAKGTRFLVLCREDFACFWCKCDLTKSGAHFDHVQRERNGQPVYLMGVASCPSCNQGRPEDELEAARVADHLKTIDMKPARAAAKTNAAKAAFQAVRAASGMGKPATPATSSFPF